MAMKFPCAPYPEAIRVNGDWPNDIAESSNNDAALNQNLFMTTIKVR
jgi:hypothetical protein